MFIGDYYPVGVLDLKSLIVWLIINNRVIQHCVGETKKELQTFSEQQEDKRQIKTISGNWTD